jgi:hypothetical protein
MRIAPFFCLETAVLLFLAGHLQPVRAGEPVPLRLIGPVAAPLAGITDETASDQPDNTLSQELESETLDLGEGLTELAAEGGVRQQQADDSEPTSSAGSPSRPPLSPQLIDLRNRLQRVLAVYSPKHLVAPQRSCWEVMHGIIAYGVDAELFRTANQRQKVNAIGWMCYNQPCHGEQLFYLDHGRLVARQGPGLQGHTGQFLAIIAQSHVPTTFPMKIGGKNFTVQDLIDYEKSDCRAGEELTFKLIAMSHYLGTDDTWTTRDGQKWNVSRLIREELKQPILRVAACGGTHRLMGHSYALYKRRKQGLPIDGQFARAEKFISDYHKYTYSLQNSDGSFSTKWFEGREAKPDVDRKVKTTGHIFEWMCFSVPEEQLQDPRIAKAANFLVTTLARQPNREWEIGPLGHALHSLRIYDRRLFKAYDAPSDPKSVLEPTTADQRPGAQADLKTALRGENPGKSAAEQGMPPSVPPIEAMRER